jgi:sulfite exporter TauE/SafE
LIVELAAVNSPAAAFVAGLVTSLHCAGMCGPMACSLMSGGRRSSHGAADAQAVSTVYHLTRLAGYALLGGLGGALGRAPLMWLSEPALRWLPWVLVIFFLAVALRWDRFLPRLSSLGRLTFKVQRWAQSRSRLSAAAALGIATPLLPCGPLYFVLSLALLTGSAIRGVEFMLAFGLGTVPLLWLAQTQYQWIRQRLSPMWLNRTRIVLALCAAVMIGWRLRSTLGFEGPAPGSFVCH